MREGGAASEGGVGPRWGWWSQDWATRWVVAWGFGSSGEEVAPKGEAQTRRRTGGRGGVIETQGGGRSREGRFAESVPGAHAGGGADAGG